MVNKLNNTIEKLKLDAKTSKENQNIFFSSQIHDLRNPLNSVLGCIDVVQSQIKTLPPDHIELIKNAQDSGEILQIMVNNILDAQKINAGKIQLHAEMIEYRVLVYKIFQSSKHLAIKKDIELEMYNKPGVPKYIEIDQTRLT